MLTTFPQCNFSLKFPEILSQYHICYHWMCLSGISKIMHSGILINMPHWAVKHKIIPLILIEKNHHTSWQICHDFTEFTEHVLKYQSYKRVWIFNLYIWTTTALSKLKNYCKLARHSFTTHNWWVLPGLNGPKLLLYIKFPWFITAGSPLQDESTKNEGKALS